MIKTSLSAIKSVKHGKVIGVKTNGNLVMQSIIQCLSWYNKFYFKHLNNPLIANNKRFVINGLFLCLKERNIMHG